MIIEKKKTKWIVYLCDEEDNIMDATIGAAVIAAATSILSSILAGCSIYITRKGNKENIESNKEISNKI